MCETLGLYDSGRKYRQRLGIIMETKRSLRFRPVVVLIYESCWLGLCRPGRKYSAEALIWILNVLYISIRIGSFDENKIVFVYVFIRPGLLLVPPWTH